MIPDDKRLHVLLLENNRQDAQLLQNLLAEAGGGFLTLVWVSELAEGLSYLASGSVDAILWARETGGFAEIAALAPGVPILVLTREGDLPVAGACDVLAKERMDAYWWTWAIQTAIERHKLQAALAQKNEQLEVKNRRFRLAAESASNPVVTVWEDGRIRAINSATQQTFGYTEAELIGQSFDLLIPHDPQQTHLVFLRQFHKDPQPPLASGQPGNLVGFRKGGQPFALTLSVSEAEEGGQVMSTCIIYDLTERNESEETLYRSNQELNRLYRASSVLFAGSMSDVQTLGENIVETIQQEFKQSNCSLFLVNDKGTELQRIAAIGPYVAELQNWKFAINGKGLVPTAVRLGQILNVPDVASHPDYLQGWHSTRSELTIPLKIDDWVIGAIDLQSAEPAAFDENDERLIASFARQAALTLQNARLFAASRRRTEELEALVEISAVLRMAETQADMMPIILKEVGDLLEADGVSLGMYDPEFEGIVIEMALGTWAPLAGLRIPVSRADIEQIVHTERMYQPTRASHQEWAEVVRRLKATRAVACIPLIEREETIGLLWVDREKPIKPEEHQLLTTIANIAANAIQRTILYEQTLRHAADMEKRVAERTAELRVANAELARAARAKDEFLANMSHELRTPLKNVLVRVEMLLAGMQGSLNEKQTRSMNIIDESGRHLLALINDILDVAKIETDKVALNIESVSVETICQASIQLTKQMAQQKHIQVTTEIVPVTIEADGRRLKQILVNLLTNAIKFTYEGGRVGLEVLTNAAEGQIHFVVWDTGIGIAQEDLPRLFEPFTQLDSGLARKYEGTGLGLGLVRRLTEMHQGRVTVKSELGQGSVFTISLPWQPDEQTAVSPRLTNTPIQFPIEPSSEKPITILVAEDNETLMRDLLEFLPLMGYQVIAARDGREVVSRAQSAKPALILMDIQMPGMDGLEAIRQIRAEADSEAMPIIALTALAMPGDWERCLAAGANAYLSKPYGLQALSDAIKAQLDGRKTEGTK